MVMLLGGQAAKRLDVFFSAVKCSCSQTPLPGKETPNNSSSPDQINLWLKSANNVQSNRHFQQRVFGKARLVRSVSIGVSLFLRSYQFLQHQHYNQPKLISKTPLHQEMQQAFSRLGSLFSGSFLASFSTSLSVLTLLFSKCSVIFFFGGLPLPREQNSKGKPIQTT